MGIVFFCSLQSNIRMKFLILSACVAAASAGVLVSNAPAHHFQAATAPADHFLAATAPVDHFSAATAPADHFQAATAPADFFLQAVAPADHFSAATAPAAVAVPCCRTCCSLHCWS